MSNPGRCHPPPPPPPPDPCLPDVIKGFFNFTDLVWCHGFLHSFAFQAQRQPHFANPWIYVDHDPGWPPGNYIWFKLWKAPQPKLYANPQYWDTPHVSCCEAHSHEVPVLWCEPNVIHIVDWDTTPGPCSCHLHAVYGK